MRLLFLLIVVVNLGLFAYGQGYFGPAPSEQGRTPAKGAPINSDMVKLGEPVLNPHTAR